MQMVERLIEAGANVQLVDVRGYTALQCAAEGGHMGPFRNLLQAGCDPMAQDHAGVSVLHSACQGGCLEIINHLQSLGADPSDRTLQGRDCLHYAALGETAHLHLLPYQPLHFKLSLCFCLDTLCLFTMRHTQEHVVACHAYLMPRFTCNFLNTDACSSASFQPYNRCDPNESVCQAPQTGALAKVTHCLPIQQIHYHILLLTPCVYLRYRWGVCSH